MIGTYFLWLFVGESGLFLSVLGYAAIEESLRERRLRRQAALPVDVAAPPRPAGRSRGDRLQHPADLAA